MTWIAEFGERKKNGGFIKRVVYYPEFDEIEPVKITETQSPTMFDAVMLIKSELSNKQIEVLMQRLQESVAGGKKS